MADRSHRLSILGEEEIQEIWGQPRFDTRERDLYFDMSPEELAAVIGRRNAVGMYFVLLLGYFHARRMFFEPSHEASGEDLQHIVGRYFPERRDQPLPPPPSRPTLRSIEDEILELLGYRRWTGMRGALVARLQELATRSTKPHYLLHEAVKFLDRERVVRPAYRSLQDLVGEVVNSERDRLTTELRKALAKRPERKILTEMLRADGALNRIGLLKQDLGDFSYTALREEVARRQAFAPLHAFARNFLKKVNISPESSKYYASLVMYYTAAKLRRMEPLVAWLYLLCFAFHRFRQVNDHLVEAFVVRVEGYTRQAQSAAEEAMHDAMEKSVQGLHGAGDVLEMFIDPRVDGAARFAAVKNKAYRLLPKDRFEPVANYLRDIAFDKLGHQWQTLGELSQTIKRNLRYVFAELEFEGQSKSEPLIEAVTFFRELARSGRSPRQVALEDFPTRFLPKKLRRYVFVVGENGKRALDVDRYEFALYRELCDAIGAFNVFVRDSNENRGLEDDLIEAEHWAKNKKAILASLDAPMLVAPIEETLAGLEQDIEAKFAQVNERIRSKANAHFQTRGKTSPRWKLVYPKDESPGAVGLYAQMPVISVSDLMKFVADETGFRDRFTHVLERNIKQALNVPQLDAALFGLATNMGLLKTAEVADMSYSSLATTARNFIRQETLRAANDTIVNATAKLPAFKLFNIQERLHSSSDGQRFETQVDTYKARHAPKYFGLGKGISVVTAVANHIPITGRVIGAHEHESHFVFDLLLHNTSDVRPERHSTDTHGTNQCNFVILHCYGYRFAPRYKNVRSRAESSLVGMRHPSEYGDWLIKPIRKAKLALIISEWPNIQRILASLGQKHVSQATIIRKLSSYSLQNRTKEALWELDSLFRTLYILDYIDDVELRQCVQRALNRGEAYHRLRRFIAYVNAGKFRVTTEEQQQIWNDCARLLANCVVYYNTAVLSKIYENLLAAGDFEAIERLKKVSPVAWQNINMFGAHDFSEEDFDIDLDAIALSVGNPQNWGIVESVLEEEIFD
ncbi:MAG: Tn3 family transposase [Proteobacteria bacterium]|nr:Tn3 family transposase [Pseudomonadota bacterium]MBS0598843.1 Tn3 family transposase [Pseudomonadota bacterium]